MRAIGVDVGGTFTDRLLAYGPSGGGYGDPLARDPRAAFDDVLDGYVSAEFARRHYVVVVVDGRLDEEATAALRVRHGAG
jgi:N-methylhydantoinase B